MSGKGRTTETTGQLPPELRPLFSSSANNVMGLQRETPLAPFTGRYPQQTAGLSNLERYSAGQSYGLFQPQGVDALALQSLMSLPGLAGAGPTTGTYEPSTLPFSTYQDFLRGPEYAPLGDDYGGVDRGRTPTGGFGPEPGRPGPAFPGGPTDNSNPTGPPGAPPPNNIRNLLPPFKQDPESGGGSGGGASPPAGPGVGMNSISPVQSQPGLVAHPSGFYANMQGNPGSYATVGSNHTYVHFGPDGYIDRYRNPPSSNGANPGDAAWVPFNAQAYVGGAQYTPPGTSQPVVSTPYTPPPYTPPSGVAPPPVTPAQFQSTQPGGVGSLSLTGGTTPLGATSLSTSPTDRTVIPVAPRGSVPTSTPPPVDPNTRGRTPAPPPTGGNVIVPGYGVPGPDTIPRMPITQVERPRPETIVKPFGPPGVAGPPRQPQPGEGIPGTNLPLPGPTPGVAVSQFGGGKLTGATPFWDSPGIQAASQRATGAGLLAQPLGAGTTQVGNNQVIDPAVRAQLEAFRLGVTPGLENQFSLSGLGRSTALPYAMTLGQSQMLTPLLSDALGREEQDIGRRYGATEEELGRRERSAVRTYEATAQQAGALSALGQQQYGQRQGAIATGLQAGGVQRGVANQGYEAAYNDFLRRQGLSEQALYQPFGSTVPGSLGSRVVSSGGGFGK